MANDNLQHLYKDKEAEEAYRDSLSTVDKDGKRVWLYPKMPKGTFTKYRRLISYILITFLIVAPFIKVNGEPFLLLGVMERKFVIFGNVFWPQDFYLFVLAMITAVVFIILFTVVFGRIFCGWICPQTIFMENVFRRIEYWIEGDYTAQKKLDKMPWNAEKIRKKTIKHTLFVLVSIIIMHTFMAYLMGVDKLWEMIQEGPQENIAGFTAMLVFTGLFYGVFSKMREQVCTAICPYGRLQGVLMDRDTIVVAYDHERGEDRHKLRKNEDREEKGYGDCIDCKQCVYVCPTGIDIRNGTQLECVNCTACIDACDSIMDKIGKPKGLVRYASERNIADKKPSTYTGRMKAYTVVLTLLIGVLVSLLIIRNDLSATILRTPGVMYQKRDDGSISNLYQMKIINKSQKEIPLDIKLIEPKGRIETVGGEGILLKSQEVKEGALFVIIDSNNLTKMSSKIKIGLFDNEGKLIKTVKTKFLGPAK